MYRSEIDRSYNKSLDVTERLNWFHWLVGSSVCLKSCSHGTTARLISFVSDLHRQLNHMGMVSETCINFATEN